MPKSITPTQIKNNNRQQIYKCIYKKFKTSQQEIVADLGLSRPTVSTNLIELEEYGLIRRNGQVVTEQLGRRAFAYSIVSDFRIAIGVEVMRTKAKIIAVDLYGHEIQREILNIRYANEESYYKEVSLYILDFIQRLKFTTEQVLGVGFSMQGVASADGRQIVYGAILGCTGLSIDVFEKWLDYPCSFVHDPDGAALCELWVSPELQNAVYLSLSRHLGGSIIANGKIVQGKHGHCATFEHIQNLPDGPLCYCGKRGCYETHCSMKALMGDEDPDIFFEAVRRGDEEPRARWATYLLNLAKLIYSLHLVHDADFILGGHLAPYFIEEDIQFIYREIQRLCPFEEENDYILISKMPSHNINIGACLSYIQNFLNDIDSGLRRN